jgi:hypothetical protein
LLLNGYKNIPLILYFEYLTFSYRMLGQVVFALIQ